MGVLETREPRGRLPGRAISRAIVGARNRPASRSADPRLLVRRTDWLGSSGRCYSDRILRLSSLRVDVELEAQQTAPAAGRLGRSEEAEEHE